MMKTTPKNMAFAAISTALSVVVLLLSGIMPSGKMALICIASFGVIFVRIYCGNSWAVCGYVITTLLALLLVPQKGSALLYGLFFGYYPLIKLSTERISRKTLRWILRFAVFNAAFMIAYLLLQSVLTAWINLNGQSFIVFLISANVVFVLYDYALTQMILIYLRKIDGRIRKNG